MGDPALPYARIVGLVNPDGQNRCFANGLLQSLAASDGAWDPHSNGRVITNRNGQRVVKSLPYVCKDTKCLSCMVATFTKNRMLASTASSTADAHDLLQQFVTANGWTLYHPQDIMELVQSFLDAATVGPLHDSPIAVFKLLDEVDGTSSRTNRPPDNPHRVSPNLLLARVRYPKDTTHVPYVARHEGRQFTLRAFVAQGCGHYVTFCQTREGICYIDDDKRKGLYEDWAKARADCQRAGYKPYLITYVALPEAQSATTAATTTCAATQPPPRQPESDPRVTELSTAAGEFISATRAESAAKATATPQASVNVTKDAEHQLSAPETTGELSPAAAAQLATAPVSSRLPPVPRRSSRHKNSTPTPSLARASSTTKAVTAPNKATPTTKRTASSPAAMTASSPTVVSGLPPSTTAPLPPAATPGQPTAVLPDSTTAASPVLLATQPINVSVNMAAQTITALPSVETVGTNPPIGRVTRTTQPTRAPAPRILDSGIESLHRTDGPPPEGPISPDTRTWNVQMYKIVGRFAGEGRLQLRTAIFREVLDGIRKHPTLVAREAAVERRAQREDNRGPLPTLDPALVQVKSIHGALNKGAIRKSRRYMTDGPFKPVNDDAINKSKKLHPTANFLPRDRSLRTHPRAADAHAMGIMGDHLIKYLKSRDPGNKGGPSGWTHDIMLSCFTKHPHLLTPIVRAIAQGEAAFPVPQGETSIWNMLRAVRGVPIDVNGKIRPIAVGEAFVTLTAGVMVQLHSDEIKEAIGPFDLGHGVPGATEALPQAISAYLAQSMEMCVIKLDVANAFNSLHPDEVLRAGNVIKALAPLAMAIYGEPADVITAHADGSSVIIKRECGVTQGCALGSVLYSMAQATAYKNTWAAHVGPVGEATATSMGTVPSTAGTTVTTATTAETVPPTTDTTTITGDTDTTTAPTAQLFLQCFKDDGYIAHTPESAFRVFDTLQAELLKLNLKLNPSKCQVYMPHPTDEMRSLAADRGITVAQQGIMVTGIPVGEDAFINAFLDKQAPKAETALDLLRTVLRTHANRRDVTLQGIFTIIRRCIPSMFNHVCRAIPPRLTMPMAQRIDDLMWDRLVDLLGLDPDLCNDPADEGITRMRMFLPTREGGMGITSIVDTVHAAYTGSWALVGSHVIKMSRGTFPPTPESWLSPGVIADLPQPIQDIAISIATLHGTGQDTANDGDSDEAPSPGALEGLPLDDLLDPDGDPIREWQTKASNNLARSKRIKVVEKLQARGNGSKELADQAAFGSALTTQSGAWLHASSARRGQRMSNGVFSLAAKTRVGMHSNETLDTECNCNTKNQNYAALPHRFSCQHAGPARTWRHNSIRDQIAQVCKSIPGALVEKEPAVQRFWRFQESNKDHKARRADILVQTPQDSWQGQLLVDVTVRVPVLQGPDTGVQALATVLAGEAAKVSFYNREFIVADHQFVPLALDPVGAMGPAGVNFVRNMARLVAPVKTYQYQVFLRELYTRISVALQCGNAAVLRASPAARGVG